MKLATVRMATVEALQRLQKRATQTDQLLAELKEDLVQLKKKAAIPLCQAEEERLATDNSVLKKDVENLRRQLNLAEAQNGLKQFALPEKTIGSFASHSQQAELSQASPANEKTDLKDTQNQQPIKKAENKGKKEGKPKSQQGGAEDAKPIDVSRLDMRVGFIMSAKKHPDADSLYVEEVDLGEANPRTIISGLVKHVPEENMQKRYAIFLCNLKPAKMRGIMSQGMIMCASTPEKVEIIDPPPDVKQGDRVSVDGFPGEPDDLLHPKKKIWEQIQPELTVNEEGLPCYRGGVWRVHDKGVCKAPTMRNSPIK